MANRASIVSDYVNGDEIITRRELIVSTEHVDKLQGNRGGQVVSKGDVDSVKQGVTSTASNLTELRNDLNSQGNRYLPSGGGTSAGVLRYDKTYAISGLDLATVNFVNSAVPSHNVAQLGAKADLATVIAKINEIITALNN